jgi:hypothetical protein
MARDNEFRTGPPSRRAPGSRSESASGRRRGRDDEFDDDVPRSRRRQKGQSNAGLLIGLSVGGGVLLVAIIILVIVLANQSDPNPVVFQFEGGGRKIQVNLPKDFPNPGNFPNPFPEGKFPKPGDFPNPFPDGKFPNGKFPFPQPGDFPIPGGIDQRAAKILPGDPFAFIQAAVREKRLADVNVSGFKIGQEYRDTPQEGAMLIGFQAGLGQFFESSTINALRPIYLTRTGEKLGNWLGPPPANPITLKAKTGYILGGVNIRAGLLIDGMSVKFMKRDKDRLLVQDSYDSEWIGGNGGSSATIGGQGHFFAGICGHLNDQRSPVSLGLITVLDNK